MRLRRPFRAAALAVVSSAGVLAVTAAPAAIASPATHPLNQQMRGISKSTRAVSRASTSRPHVRLSAKTGPPTSTVTVSGSGFGAYKAVDIYFDTHDEALASANAKGAFHGVTIDVPASATPGTHYITAVARHSGRSAQAKFLVNTNWAQFRYSGPHEGFNPYENLLSAASVPGMNLDWSYTTGPTGLDQIDSSPAVANGVVYIGSQNGSVYALSASTGAELWSHFTGLNSIRSSPAVANGVVYIGGGDVYALNASTGAELWSYSTGNIVASSPAVANGVVYVGSDNDTLYALDASTGAELWHYTTGGDVSSSPAVANGVVYVGSGDGNVYALDASTGAKMWRYTTVGAYNAVDSSPAVVNGVVYIGSGDKNVYALNASTGAELWRSTIGGFVYSSPAVANGVVYVGSLNHSVYALNASTGAELWRSTTGGQIYSSPAVANGIVDIGSDDGKVYAFGLIGGTRLSGGSTRKTSGVHSCC